MDFKTTVRSVREWQPKANNESSIKFILYVKREPLNVSAVKRTQPELVKAVYAAINPFCGWKQALKDAAHFLQRDQCRTPGPLHLFDLWS
jgi:hypothetical protein